MSKTQRVWNAIGENLRCAAACILISWFLRVIPKTDKHTLVALGNLLRAMQRDDAERDERDADLFEKRARQ